MRRLPFVFGLVVMFVATACSGPPDADVSRDGTLLMAHAGAGLRTVTLIVGFTRHDASRCSLVDGVDVIYEFDGHTYAATWGSRYIVELDDGAGCAQIADDD